MVADAAEARAKAFQEELATTKQQLEDERRRPTIQMTIHAQKDILVQVAPDSTCETSPYAHDAATSTPGEQLEEGKGRWSAIRRLPLLSLRLYHSMYLSVEWMLKIDHSNANMHFVLAESAWPFAALDRTILLVVGPLLHAALALATLPDSKKLLLSLYFFFPAANSPASHHPDLASSWTVTRG
ncbi:hypothetical protein C8R44DRAFT_880584 [Mycena epipterygia]|nr:hypothetical protein C8R44DRAFT_880584 [Mycena epipterygia]